MAIVVRIAPNPILYVRDPQETDLGRSILSSSIDELHERGLESFTFRKLALRIGCTEASVYRYFNSKHQLLQYLVAYYWDWVHHIVNTSIQLQSNPVDRLKSAISSLTKPMLSNPAVPYINEDLLHQVVLTEGTKAYHSKDIDQENTKGIFIGYKSLTSKLSELILAVNPDFPYPRSLASSLFEMAHNHIYFAAHLPKLTDLKYNDQTSKQLEKMLYYWVDRLVFQKE